MGDWAPLKTLWRATGFKLAMSSCSFALGSRGGAVVGAGADDDSGVSNDREGRGAGTGGGGGGA